mmetsp:Transcript_4683/g.7262  ORF Transcript_4683/g.7262 Transcript_4683/m.7262 type:complete len:292 (-) Transcript_4683:577-1452(-)
MYESKGRGPGPSITVYRALNALGPRGMLFMVLSGLSVYVVLKSALSSNWAMCWSISERDKSNVATLGLLSASFSHTEHITAWAAFKRRDTSIGYHRTCIVVYALLLASSTFAVLSIARHVLSLRDPMPEQNVMNDWTFLFGLFSCLCSVVAVSFWLFSFSMIRELIPSVTGAPLKELMLGPGFFFAVIGVLTESVACFLAKYINLKLRMTDDIASPLRLSDQWDFVNALPSDPEQLHRLVQVSQGYMSSMGRGISPSSSLGNTPLTTPRQHCGDFLILNPSVPNKYRSMVP